MSKFGEDQDKICRQALRLEKGKKDEKYSIFTLTEEEFNHHYNALNSNDYESINESISLFSRHYLYNKFEFNEQTQLIIKVAVSILQNSNQLDKLTKNCFELLSHVINKPLNGLSFIIYTSVLQIFENNIINLDSPFFDRALLSIVKISEQSQNICMMVHDKFPIPFFINILNKYNCQANANISINTWYILYFFSKYKELLNEAESLLLIELINNFFQTIKLNKIESYEYDILRMCIKILMMLFQKSAKFCDTEYTQNFILFFNSILQLNINDPKDRYNNKLARAVLSAYVPLLETGSALKEPGINILIITSLIISDSSSIQCRALGCLVLFIRCSPGSIAMLLQTHLLHNLEKICKYGSFIAKQKSLPIFELIMKHGTNEDRILMLNPNLVTYFISLAKEVNDKMFLGILNSLNLMLSMESALGHDFQIHSTFLQNDGIQMIEDKLMDGSDCIYEASQQFIKNHFDNK